MYKFPLPLFKQLFQLFSIILAHTHIENKQQKCMFYIQIHLWQQKPYDHKQPYHILALFPTV